MKTIPAKKFLAKKILANSFFSSKVNIEGKFHVKTIPAKKPKKILANSFFRRLI